MDTTHMEYTAEDLIAHKLQRSGLLVAKPKFDKDGTDLICLMEVKDGAKFCRIQCKGRSLIQSKNSNIIIPKDYVTDSFIVFLFIDDANPNKTHLYSFFKKDIQKWSLTQKDEYILYISSPGFEDKLTGNIFSENSLDKIKETIIKADMKDELSLFKPEGQIHIFEPVFVKEDECHGSKKTISEEIGNPKNKKLNPAIGTITKDCDESNDTQKN